MSTYYGYHCKTDNETSDCWMNHGEQVLSDLARLAPLFRAINEGDSLGYIEIRVMGHGWDPIIWLEKHAQHDIELHNEYGETEPLLESS